MANKTKSRGGIDRDWFFGLLEKNQQSVRGMAKHLDLDVSGVSRMLSGKRKMKMEEANAIARFLNAPVSEVLSHVGVAMDLDGTPTSILLAATVGKDGAIHRLKEPRPLPQSVIDRSHAAISAVKTNSRIIAAQIRCDNGALAMWDDSVILFRHTEIVEPASIGALSVARMHDGNQVLCRIERARKTGEAHLRLPDGSVKDVILQTAAPVIALIP